MISLKSRRRRLWVLFLYKSEEESESESRRVDCHEEEDGLEIENATSGGDKKTDGMTGSFGVEADPDEDDEESAEEEDKDDMIGDEEDLEAGGAEQDLEAVVAEEEGSAGDTVFDPLRADIDDPFVQRLDGGARAEIPRTKEDVLDLLKPVKISLKLRRLPFGTGVGSRATRLWKSLFEENHYLGDFLPVSLPFLVRCGAHPVAFISAYLIDKRCLNCRRN